MGETPDPQGDPLQFEKAEFADPGAAQAGCTRCREPISGTYYEANGNVVCGRCQAALRFEQTQGWGAGRLLRAALFGGLAAALGSALYYGVRALTGMEFGLIAIVVGVMVGARSATARGGREAGSTRGWRCSSLTPRS
jgi:hypothetical protein